MNLLDFYIPPLFSLLDMVFIQYFVPRSGLLVRKKKKNFAFFVNAKCICKSPNFCTWSVYYHNGVTTYGSSLISYISTCTEFLPSSIAILHDNLFNKKNKVSGRATCTSLSHHPVRHVNPSLRKHWQCRLPPAVSHLHGISISGYDDKEPPDSLFGSWPVWT